MKLPATATESEHDNVAASAPTTEITLNCDINTKLCENIELQQASTIERPSTIVVASATATPMALPALKRPSLPTTKIISPVKSSQIAASNKVGQSIFYDCADLTPSPGDKQDELKTERSDTDEESECFRALSAFFNFIGKNNYTFFPLFLCSVRHRSRLHKFLWGDLFGISHHQCTEERNGDSTQNH